MKITVRQLLSTSAILSALVVGGYLSYGVAGASNPKSYKLVRLFPVTGQPAVSFDDSIIANPILDLSQGRPLLIVPVSNGDITVLDSETGELDWKINVPTPDGQQAQLISTPVQLGDKLAVLYQCIEQGVRVSHRMAILDLTEKKWDENFPVLTLSAEMPDADGKATVKFNPPTAFSHAAVKYAKTAGAPEGTLYASFGNAGDTQPFHGWMFEIDMAAWQKQGASQAVSHVLLTTPEAQCPVTLEYATQEMICGGGIWGPAGPQLYPAADGYELFVPTGNGQVDLVRHDYANTVMRVQPGLKFDDGCDSQLCKNFNPKQPDRACLSSCKNLFIPRPPDGDPGLKPSNRECDDKTFWECLAWMDYDLGASSPVKVDMKSGHSVLVQPGKDGAVYLIDAGHLGTQYDRLQIAEVCGTPEDVCKASWMGMIVTQPVFTQIDEDPVVVIPTFVPDQSHPAGLVALKIVLSSGKPTFKRFWQYPEPSSLKAVKSFRSHPSLPVISSFGKQRDAVVWTVDIGANGTLYGIRIKDGAVLVEQSLLGTGRQLSAPVVYGNTLYLASIMPNTQKAMIEAYRMVYQE
jgi:outer membrane protein assembly factor BamB